MKRFYLPLFLFVILIAQSALPANWRPGEMLVQITVNSPQEIMRLNQQRFIIDKVEGDHISILVTLSELAELKSLGYQPKILIPNMEDYSQQQLSSPEFLNYHDYYSTLTLVDSLVAQFPGIVSKQIYGETADPSHYQLYAVKISDNVNTDEPEPEISFDGCHHGDEIMGAEIIIQLMRELCTSYGTDPQITNLINNREIWIYPFINPYGRQNMTRYNSAGVDVNRDWGYMWDGDGGSPSPFSQVESQSAMKWINDNQFVVSQSDHGGDETISYPWSYRATQAPDHDPIDFLAANYSSHSGYSPTLSYYQGFSGMYPINGSSKDYYYAIMGSVGWTLEVSYNKQPPSSQIQQYYTWNRPSMLYLIDMAGKGIKGLVTDAGNGGAVPAIIWASDASHNYWPVYADPEVGDFHKFLLPGTYSLTFTANGYQSQIVNNVVVADTGATQVNLQLQPQLGTYAYRVVLNRIPNNNTADEGYTAGAIGAPDNVNYSLGKSGYIVLDMGESIFDFPGNDFRVVEGDATPEGYIVKVAGDWLGPWTMIGTGMGTQDFDLGFSGISDFRYIRIEDDGDGPQTAADAGFDLDAVEGRLIPATGPFVMAVSYTVNDSSTNNNGVIEAGETVGLDLMLQNLGVDPAQNVRVRISSGDPLLTVLSDSVWYGNLPAGDQGNIGPYSISVSPATPDNSKLNLLVDILADGNNWTHPLQLLVKKGSRIAANAASLDFPNTFLTFTSNIDLRINNSGTDSLKITDFLTTTPFFWVEENALSVAPGGNQTVHVKFMPQDTVNYTDTLVIKNNDPMNFILQIPMSGTGKLAPDIAVSQDSIALQVLPTDSTVVPLTVSNNGAGELIFTAQIGNYQPGGSPVDSAGGNDSFGHVWIDSDEPGGPQYNWIELGTGAGTQIPISGLNATSSSISIGFDVPFYNESYPSLRVCNNGWVSFTTFSVSYNNTTLPSNLAPRAMIAPLWDNLNMQADSRIYYAQESNYFVIEWENAYTATGYGPHTFELIIYDNGSLLLQYKELVGLENSYTVGMQNAAADDGFHIAYNQNYLHDQMAIIINRRSWVSLNPVGGTIAPGGQLPLDVIFKTSSFPLGDFWASVEIRSNDPAQETVVVPLHMRVDSVMSISDASNQLPTRYRLEQNYPNPFNPTTTIRYQIPTQGQVKLEIFNTSGQVVKTLVNGTRQPGFYSTVWDGRNSSGQVVASGIYFYRIKSETFTSVRRMLLLK